MLKSSKYGNGFLLSILPFRSNASKKYFKYNNSNTGALLHLYLDFGEITFQK